MTPNDDFIRQLEVYLDEYEGPTPLPEAVRDAVRARLPSTMQRPAGWPERRFPAMNPNRMVRIGIGAAAVIAALAVGISLLTRGGTGDGPSPTRTTPRPTADLNAIRLPYSGPLEAGAYEYELPSVPRLVASFIVPQGWSSEVGGFVVKDGAELPAGSGFGFWIVDNIYGEPCQWTATLLSPAVGPTVDDLVVALSALPDRNASVPTEVTIGGYSGKRLRLSVPTDVDFAGCHAHEYRTWESVLGPRFHQGPGQIDDLWILDVSGQRVVIGAAYFPATPDQDVAEIEAMIESIKFATGS